MARLNWIKDGGEKSGIYDEFGVGVAHYVALYLNQREV